MESFGLKTAVLWRLTASPTRSTTGRSLKACAYAITVTNPCAFAQTTSGSERLPITIATEKRKDALLLVSEAGCIHTRKRELPASETEHIPILKRERVASASGSQSSPQSK